MIEITYRFKDYLSLIFCIIISLILLNSNDNRQIQLLRLKLSNTAGVIISPLEFVPKTLSLHKINRELNRRIFELTHMNAELVEMEAENKRLRELMNFAQRSELRSIPAQVTSRSAGGPLSYIVIDRGEIDGLKPGTPVVSSAGLVGQIAEADENKSLCQIMLDGKFGVAVKDQRSRVDGILHWDSGDICRLDGISYTMEIRQGDTLITSGLGGVYPKGLYTGIVIHIEKDPAKLYQRILVAPFTDFHRLEEVFVLIP